MPQAFFHTPYHNTFSSSRHNLSFLSLPIHNTLISLLKMAKDDPPPPPYSTIATMAPIEIPLEDLEAGHQPSANSPAIRFHHNRNSRRIVECDNGCSCNGCSCTGCTGAFFLPNVCDGCSINWGGTVVLFAIMVTITLIFWFQSKKA